MESGGCSTARAPLALALALDLEHIREHRAHLIASGAGLVRDGTQNLGDGLYRILSGLFCFSHWKKGKKQPHRKTKKAGREGRPLFVNSFYRRSASVPVARLRRALGRAIHRVAMPSLDALIALEFRDRFVCAVSESKTPR